MLCAVALLSTFAAISVQAAPATSRLVRMYAPTSSSTATSRLVHTYAPVPTSSSSSKVATSTQWYLAPVTTSSTTTTSSPVTTTPPAACASYVGGNPLEGVAWGAVYCHDHPECCPGGTTYTTSTATRSVITASPTPNPSTVPTVPVKVVFSTTEKAGAAEGVWPYQELSHIPCPLASVGTTKDDIESLASHRITIQMACDTWITVGDLNGTSATFKVSGVCTDQLCSGDMVALPKYTAQQVFGAFEEGVEAKYALQGYF